MLLLHSKLTEKSSLVDGFSVRFNDNSKVVCFSESPCNVWLQAVLGVGGICLLIFTIGVAVIGVFYFHRKRSCADWKRPGNAVPWPCGGCCPSDSAVHAHAHQRRGGTELVTSNGLCPREIIPLRSSDIVENPNYLRQIETRPSTRGKSVSFISLFHFCLWLVLRIPCTFSSFITPRGQHTGYN